MAITTIIEIARRVLTAGRTAALCALLSTLGFTPTLHAQQPALTLDQAAAIAEQRYGGKVVNIQPIGNPPTAYSVRILQSDGKVITVEIDGHAAAPGRKNR